MNSCERTKEMSPTAIKNKNYSPIKKLNKIEAVPDFTKNLEGGEAELDDELLESMCDKDEDTDSSK